jgi:hypothetical protein
MASFEGTVGDLVFYREGDETLVRKRQPDPQPQSLSEAQLAQVARFAGASRWARTVLLDPDVKAAYQRACHGHLTPHNVALRDSMHAPAVTFIAMDAYKGKSGDVIRVSATDDFKVIRVSLLIRTVAGETLEEGQADWNALEQEWVYTTRSPVPTGTMILVVATAFDLPGNSGSLRAFHYIEDQGQT